MRSKLMTAGVAIITDFARNLVFGRPSMSELGRGLGQIMIDGMRDGIEQGPRPDTFYRIGEMIESGMIRRSPFWDDPDPDR